jgi:hypothetical protein
LVGCASAAADSAEKSNLPGGADQRPGIPCDRHIERGTRGRDGGVREELAARMKKKKERRVYLPRVLGSGQAMMPADLKRLHKYMREIEHISVISDEVRAIVEEEWPELVHKLPAKTPRG